jgi:hypothetical protein
MVEHVTQKLPGLPLQRLPGRKNERERVVGFLLCRTQRKFHRLNGDKICAGLRSFRAGARRLNGFQIFDQVLLFLLSQLQFEDTIVVVNDVRQGCEPAVMVEASFMDLLHVKEGA